MLAKRLLACAHILYVYVIIDSQVPVESDLKSKLTNTTFYAMFSQNTAIDSTLRVEPNTLYISASSSSHRRRLHRGNRELRPGTHARTGANVAFCPDTFHGCGLIF